MNRDVVEVFGLWCGCVLSIADKEEKHVEKKYFKYSHDRFVFIADELSLYRQSVA